MRDTPLGEVPFARPPGRCAYHRARGSSALKGVASMEATKEPPASWSECGARSDAPPLARLIELLRGAEESLERGRELLRQARLLLKGEA